MEAEVREGEVDVREGELDVREGEVDVREGELDVREGDHHACYSYTPTQRVQSPPPPLPSGARPLA